ncbi:MAG: Neelaredoxin, partial [Candidatus Marinimicrobia bacterium]|nr:Neelaredoxin [Candidatus Neomarinimicrobiota bacterium]
HHSVSTELKIDQPGELVATSYCNIHGLWEFSKEVSLK